LKIKITALSSIDDSNAEEGEDETLKERHEIPMQDYDTFDRASRRTGCFSFHRESNVNKEHVEEIAFLAKYNHFIEEKKKNSPLKIQTQRKIFNIILL
jgi:hypothetical protein